MKKIATLVTAALVTGSVLSGSVVFASSAIPVDQLENVSDQTIQLVDSSNYMKFSGVISELKQNENSLTLIVEDQQNSMQMIFPISNEVLLLNSRTTEKLEKHTMEKGLKVDVYYDKNKPMPMIYPATIAPKMIIVNDKELGQVKISKFDENFLSLNNELKLNLSENTVLLNEQGDQIKEEELHGKELIVFYDVTTKSIPAQTTPKKIIALDHTSELTMEIQRLIKEDHYIKDGAKMLPIRKVAEHLGYKVEWHQETLSIIVSKQNLSFQISIGEKAYGYNRSLRYFDVTPELKNGKSYISDEFLKMLLMN